MRAAARVFFATVLLLSFGCSEEELTEVVVVVDSQPMFRSALSTLRFRVTGPSGDTVVDEQIEPDSASREALFPRSLSLSPAGSTRLSAHVDLVATGPLVAALEREATVPFVAGERRMLRILFHPACVQAQCSEGQTCGNDGTCRAVEIVETELERWGGNIPEPPECTAQERSSPETCDGLDNDCDDVVDEGMTDVACVTDQEGVCRAGTQSCVRGAWSSCTRTVEPKSVDYCDGTDDDCDGSIDEKLDPWPCDRGHTNEGECVIGTNYCMGALGWVCMGDVPPEIERCDYKDNDCDGTIDEEVCL